MQVITDFPFFARFKDHLQLTGKKGKFNQGLKALERELTLCFNALVVPSSGSNIRMKEAYEGRFTHAQWIQITQAHLAPQKRATIMSQDKFADMMFVYCASFEHLDFFANQLQTIFGEIIITPTYPGFSPICSNMQRFIINIQDLLTPPSHHLTFPEDPVVSSFEQYFCHTVESIEKIFYEKLLQNETLPLLNKNIDKLQRDNYARSYWNDELAELSFTTSLLEEVKLMFLEESSNLNNVLKEVLAPFKGLSQEQKVAIVDKIHTMCINQSLFLVQVTMIADDISTILDGSFSLHPKYIPDELVDFIALDYLDEFLVTSSEPQDSSLTARQSDEPEIELQEEQFEIDPDHEPDVRFHVEQPKTHPVTKSQVGKGAKKGPDTTIKVDYLNPKALVKAVKAQKSVDPEEIKRILRKRKTDKILTLFAQCKCTVARQSGHLILRNEHGQIVIVPRSKEQDLGTSLSIGRMMTSQLQRLTAAKSREKG